eukprot:1158105-Pelagomonas_calceolata.AAC.5
MEVLGVAQRLLCTLLGRKKGFSNWHHVTSAPGLKLLLGCLIMLQCQILQGGTPGGACRWGNPLGRMWARKEGPPLELAHAASCRPPI